MNRGKKKAAAEDAVVARKERLAEEEAAAKQLQEKHTLSKVFGLSFVKKLNDNAVAKALHRWKQCIFKDKTALLRNRLDELSAKMKEMIGANDDLEEKNDALAGENEELRQLSLESVDLAKVSCCVLISVVDEGPEQTEGTAKCRSGRQGGDDKEAAGGQQDPEREAGAGAEGGGRGLRCCHQEAVLCREGAAIIPLYILIYFSCPSYTASLASPC